MRSFRVLSAAGTMSKVRKKEVKQVEPKETGPVLTNKNGNIMIQVLAKPGAKCNAITNINEDGVGVQIAGKAVDGEANAELVKYMTRILDLKKNEISLDKGSKSRQKILLIDKKGSTVEQIVSKLKEEIGK